jgi:hypothetical protein
MTLQQPIITSGIARTLDAETSLAAYGVALSMVVFLESPIQMLLSATNALAHDGESYRLLRSFTIFMGLALSGLLLLLAWPMVGSAVISQFIGVPPLVIEPVLYMLLVMFPWPLVVGWRRFNQGIMIGRGYTQAVSLATFARLIVISTIVFITVRRLKLPGVLVGSLALMGGAVIEMGIINFFVIRAMRQEAHIEIKTTTVARKLPILLRFYSPLALTSILSIATWPLVSVGIGHAGMPKPSLAAWSLTLSILWLITTPIQMLQETVIALVQRSRRIHTVIRFGLAVGLVGSVILGIFAFTPLNQTYLQIIVAAPDKIVPFTISAARILVPLPLIVAGQSLLRGLLIARGTTVVIRWAMMTNMVVISFILLGGVIHGSVPGIVIAPIALLGGLFTETMSLWWKFKR